MEVPNIPHIPSKGVHRVPFVPSEVYIERSDFKEVLLYGTMYIRAYNCISYTDWYQKNVF